MPITPSTTGQPTATVIQTLTVSAPPAQLTPTISSEYDPICNQWDIATRGFTAQQNPWARIDANLAAGQWNPQQRADATTVAPVMRAVAANLRELANRAYNRFLRVLLRAQAVYEEASADRAKAKKRCSQAMSTAPGVSPSAVSASSAWPEDTALRPAIPLGEHEEWPAT